MSYSISLFLSTFVLEDVALASSVALVSQGKIGFTPAFTACFLGISIGDLGLYGFGYLASHFQSPEKFSRFKKSSSLATTIFVSRMIPGTRLPTYLGAGYLRFSFWGFLFLTVASVFLWVLIAMLAGKSLQTIFSNHWIPIVLCFFVGMQFVKAVLPKFFNSWDRKAYWQSFRQWTHFEFWPAWFFYLPLIPYYLFLSFKYRSIWHPFYANPELKHGGLIGESKWDFLKYLDPNAASTLASVKIPTSLDEKGVLNALEAAHLTFPFILKPDVGQRGFGVRIIRDQNALIDYLSLSDFDKIAQKLSKLPGEAGIFYIRHPENLRGFLFSITDKVFPFVIGDGITQLGDLILKDPRARIIAAVYFERHREKLDSIPKPSEVVPLSECGNHCQGAIFKNGNFLNSEALTDAFDQIAKKIPNFFFGRFDIRYLDHASLQKGLNFEIVEVNGAGAEATHIWDASTRLQDAYRTLFQQWEFLFQIGKKVKDSEHTHQSVHLLSFLKDSSRVFFRKDRLSISS